MASAERRIILLGNAGSCKSFTGNRLIGYQPFEECRSRLSETRECKLRKCFVNEGNVSYSFVDTPGFLKYDGNLTENLLEIQRSTEICPDPHAFLLVLSSCDISDEEYVYTVDDLLRVAFGKRVFYHCIVIYIHGERFCTDMEFTQIWQKSKALVKLVKRCGGRIIRVENKPSTICIYSRKDRGNRVHDAVEDDVNRVYDVVEKMSDSGRNQYNCKIIKTYKNILEECLSKSIGQTYLQQIDTLVHAIDFKNQQFQGRKTKNEKKRKIVLVGKSGNGKSSTGNTLLGRNFFAAVRSPSSVTEECRLGVNKYSINNVLYNFSIVDTPGLMDTDVPLAKRQLQLQESIDLCSQPHAFLLIFSSKNRMTKDENYTVDILRAALGEEVFDHCIVVFTHGNDFQTDQEFKYYWEQSSLLVDLVERCGGRIVRIENDSSVDPEDNEHVKEITETMEKMSIGGRKTYEYDHIEKHKNVIKEHLDTYNGPVDYPVELSAQVHAIGEHLSTAIWRVMIVGGAIAGVAAGIYVFAKSPTVRKNIGEGVNAAGGAISSVADCMASSFCKK